MTYIISMDPAAENSVSDTGYCLAHYTDEAPLTIIDSGTLPGGFQGFCDVVHGNGTVSAWLRFKADVVVCEKFVPYNKLADSTPLLIEGVIRYLRPKTILQPASGKNSLVPDSFLKDMGLWVSEGHHKDEREAIRHAYYYLAKTEHIPTLKQLSE